MSIPTTPIPHILMTFITLVSLVMCLPANASDTDVITFTITDNGTHIIYDWPTLNSTLITTDFEQFNSLQEAAINTSDSQLTKRAQNNCLNRSKNFKRTKCTGCGSSKGFYSSHNCKSASGKGYSCLEKCTCALGSSSDCKTIKCDEYCGAVSAFKNYEHGVCWTSKCKKAVLHDEF